MRLIKVIALGALVAVAGVAGWWFLIRTPPDPREWRNRVKYEDVLPDFTEPGPGPRGPQVSAFGLEVGRTTLAQARHWIADRALACKDTSPRALMANYRDEKANALVEAQAEGKVDGIAGASYLYKTSKHEKSPQVRLSCERVRFAVLGDRPRPEDQLGRVLLIFDSESLPLRHIALQSRVPAAEHARARQWFIEAEAAMGRALGEPTIRRGEVPAEGAELAPLLSLRREWKFADLEAKVSALRYGKDVTVYEEVGVPWPVRPTAPADPR